MGTSPKPIEGPGVSRNSRQPVQSVPARSNGIMDPNDITIVLLGETGVGKSTFINAFANYLKYGSLQEAIDSQEITCLIPTKFTICDDDFEEHVVSFGEDENECYVPGASSTQSIKSHRFPWHGRYVTLMDTPGIGDTRGIGQDEKNFDRVVDALCKLHFVHAFFILLKPNNARLTVLFRYCITQLLSRLDKSASKNIVFVFTNSRSTFYKPGDSVVPIKRILESIKETSKVEIPFGMDNVFCVDNEAFRFLLANRDHIDFTQDQRKDFDASWEKSRDISLTMLSYVAGLTPHKIQDTVSINQARRLAERDVGGNVKKKVDRKRAKNVDEEREKDVSGKYAKNVGGRRGENSVGERAMNVVEERAIGVNTRKTENTN